MGNGIRLYADADRKKSNSNNKSQGQSSDAQQQQQICVASVLGLGSCNPGWLQPLNDINNWLGGGIGPESPGPGFPVPGEGIAVPVG